MPTRAQSLQARIDRILKQFASDDLREFVSGFNDASPLGAIDDGDYGDPLRNTKPDFVQKVQKDIQGWE